MKLKQKLFLLLLLTLVGWQVWSLAQPAQAGLTSSMVEMIQTLAEAIYTGLMPFILQLLKPLLENPVYFLDFSQVNFPGGLPDFGSTSVLITRIWNLCMLAANSIFIIALVYSIINIIIGTNANVYNIKVVLTKLIPAVLLANLSLAIIRAFVSIGNLFTQGFAALFDISTDAAVLFISDLGTLGNGTGFWSGVGNFFGNLGEGVISVFSNDNASTGPAVASFILLIIIFWVFLKITLILLERTFWLFILTVSAPLAFAADLLPLSFTQKLSSKWAENVLKWIIIFPLIQTAIFAAIHIWTTSEPALDATTINNLIKNSALIHDMPAGQLGPLFIGITILYFAGKIPEYIKPGGATPLSGFVGSSPMQGYKAVSKPITETLTGKNALGKSTAAQFGMGYKLALGTKTGRALEAKRQTLSAGGHTIGSVPWLIAKTLNPKGEIARTTAERNIDMGKARLNTTSDQLSKLKQNFSKITSGMNWDDLSSKEKDDFKKDKNISIRNHANSIDKKQDQLDWLANTSVKEAPIEEMKPVANMLGKILKPGATAADVIQNAKNMNRVKRGRNPEEAAEASAGLARPDVQAVLRSKNFDPDKLSPTISKKYPKSSLGKVIPEILKNQEAGKLTEASALDKLSLTAAIKIERFIDSEKLEIEPIKFLLDSGDTAAAETMMTAAGLKTDEQQALKKALSSASAGGEGMTANDIQVRLNALSHIKSPAGGDKASPEEIRTGLNELVAKLKTRTTGTAAASAPTGTTASPTPEATQVAGGIASEEPMEEEVYESFAPEETPSTPAQPKPSKTRPVINAAKRTMEDIFRTHEKTPEEMKKQLRREGINPDQENNPPKP
ncbi:MAG: hypothetical protein WC805_02350 [Patescibacteria group bacterium]|jgi:hypothetical protein